MKRTWNEIKWMFEPDGSLRDIYVQDVSINEWEIIIDLINEKYEVKHEGTRENLGSHRINKKYVVEYLLDKTGEKESRSASILLGKLRLNCHFFLVDQIEFDVDPKEVTSINDFELIEEFMIEISKSIENQVTLTEENTPELPLVKINVKEGINRVLTADEVNAHWGNTNSITDKMKLFKTEVEMKFFPNRFKEKILKSANQRYKSTKKDENVW